jgi:preprotein translocase subunit YajC
MSFLISDAMAQTAAGPGQGDLLQLLFPIGLVVLLYFLMIRPQVKRQKEHAKLVAALAKGDEVATSGGLVGRITDMGENFVQVEIADGVNIKVRRQAIEAVLPKGSIKEL